MAQYLEDCPTLQLENPERWTLQGYSKAGEQTGFWLHPEKIVLDAGLGTQRQPKAVYITHKHIDHTGSLPYILSGRSGLRPVYMVKEVLGPMVAFQNAIRWFCEDDSGEPDRDTALAKQGCDPHIVEPGMTFGASKTLYVEVLAAYHETPSVGYGFGRIKQKLKQEYANLSGPEIGKLRKAGIEITKQVVVPQLCFFCDSNTRNFLDHNEWRKYPVIVCECTGAGRPTPSKYHSNLTDLLPIIKSQPNAQWVLIHTSQSFDVEKEGEARLKEVGLGDLNVSFWNNRPSNFC